MNWRQYAIIEDHPALQHLPLGARMDIEQQVSSRLRAHPGWWLVVLLCAGGGVSSAVLAMRLLGRFKPSDGSELAGLLAAQVAATVAMLFAGIRLRRRTLLHVLRIEKIRPAVCVTCGYDLRATPGDLCPECGQLIAGA